MWQRGAPPWDSRTTHNMKMTNADGAEGDRFGHRVGVQFEGEHIYVSNAWKQADNYAAGEVHVFVRKRPRLAGQRRHSSNLC